MTERKQCMQCGAHTFGRVCSVCRSVRLEAVPGWAPGRRRFRRRRALVSELEVRERIDA